VQVEGCAQGHCLDADTDFMLVLSGAAPVLADALNICICLRVDLTDAVRECFVHTLPS